jgi:hypothetical protein
VATNSARLDFRLLRDLQSVVDLDTEITDGVSSYRGGDVGMLWAESRPQRAMPLRIQRGTLAPRPARGLDMHGDNATLQQRQLIFIPDARVDVSPAAVGLEFVQVAIPAGSSA